MAVYLKIEKVTSVPTTPDPSTMYLIKGADGTLKVGVSSNDGSFIVSTPSSDDLAPILNAQFAKSPIIDGPKTLNLSETATYKILNFSFGETYMLTPILGTVSRVNDTITYTAPDHGRLGGFIIKLIQRYN